MEEGQCPAPCWVLECRGIEVKSQGSCGPEVHQLEGSLTEQGRGAQDCHHCGLTRNAIPPPVGARGLEGAVGAVAGDRVGSGWISVLQGTHCPLDRDLRPGRRTTPDCLRKLRGGFARARARGRARESFQNGRLGTEAGGSGCSVPPRRSARFSSRRSN